MFSVFLFLLCIYLFSFIIFIDILVHQVKNEKCCLDNFILFYNNNNSNNITIQYSAII